MSSLGRNSAAAGVMLGIAAAVVAALVVGVWLSGQDVTQSDGPEAPPTPPETAEAEPTSPPAQAEGPPPPQAESPPDEPVTDEPEAEPEPPAAVAPTAEEKPEAKPAEPWKSPRFTERQKERDRMVEVIRAYGLRDKTLLAAMTAVPRHEFVLDKYQSWAYADQPLPIGHGQTISQPYIVAEMTRQLQLKPGGRVLEIGTGSGYQAAVLTEITAHVYTIEIIKELADSAAKRLKRLGYTVVKTRHGDGYHGWAEAGPFDGIIVTAAAARIPPPLLEQLAEGGRMVIPIGGQFAVQSLMLVEKRDDGSIRSRSLMPVRFVPFLRKEPTAD